MLEDMWEKVALSAALFKLGMYCRWLRYNIS